MWRERRFEIETRKSLGDTHESMDLWSRYLHTHEDLERNILPYIATQVPDLSDHGVDHIGNVIDNIGLVLGMTSGAIVPRTPSQPRSPRAIGSCC